MKNLKRQPNIYSASNVWFDSDTLNGVSYNWWYFVRKMHGKVIFNEYRYSNTTSKHQYKVRSLLQQLGIKIDIVVNVKESLTNIKLEEMTLKQLKAESDRQIVERESEKKNRQKIKRVVKRLKELGLYHTNGTPVDPWIEAASIVRGVR
jgi:hypothetical protein